MKISINKLQQIPRILFTITLFSILAACGGSSSSSTPATPPVDPPDASLSSLVPSASTFTPKFPTENTLKYALFTNLDKITVTPTVSQATAEVKVNGIKTESGKASHSINLTVGSENIITIIVTTADGITTKTYTITVTRIDLSVRLSALTVSAGELSPAFAEDVTEYTVTTTTVTPITVTPTLKPQDKEGEATVTVNGTKVTSGSASDEIKLTAGGATKIAVVTTKNNITKTYNITVNRIAANVELINPNAGMNQKFGEKVVQLANGNIVVHAPGYDTDKGAVHFYKPTSSKAEASFYGTNAGDNFGSGGIIPLANNHFLIVSPSADNGTLDAAGSVTWVNGSTGDIDKTLQGDSANDALGSGGVHLLDDNTIIINSPNYKSNGIATGAVMLLTNSGDSIKTTLYGNDNTDGFTTTKLGDKGITLLGNGKFVIVSTEHTNKTFANAGLVQLVSSKGEVLKSLTGQGQKADEKFGGDGITPLKDGNFLIATQTHDASEGSTDLTNAGSIHLINGADGNQIGKTLIGNKKDGYLGKTSGSGKTSAGNAATTTITPLGNNNYVVLHHTADSPTVPNAGSIRLFNGVNGEEIIFKGTGTGTPVFGSYANDFAKQENFTTKITVLKNHNFVVTAPHSDTQDVQFVGSIRLMDGTSGAQLSLQEGGRRGDFLGNGDTIELSNGKYVVASPSYSSNKAGEGLVRVFTGEGDTFESLEGNIELDNLGDSGLTALGNNKFVIVSKQTQKDLREYVGSIQLVDASGTINTQNIKKFPGDYDGDFFGFGGVTRLNNHNFVFGLPGDDGVNSTDNAGSVQAVNGTTDVADQKILGKKEGDMNSVQMIRPTTTGDYFILSQPLADDYGSNAGKVTLVVPTFSTTNN